MKQSLNLIKEIKIISLKEMKRARSLNEYQKLGKNPSGTEIVHLPDNLTGGPIELRSLYDHYYELDNSEIEQYDTIAEKRPFPSKPSMMQVIKLSA